MIKPPAKALGLAILISSNIGFTAGPVQAEIEDPETQCQISSTKKEKIAEATTLLKELKNASSSEDINKKIEVVRRILDELKTCGEKELDGDHPTCD